ncbi:MULTISPECIES: hypothetical protein [Cyanophyceae]|uniref:hypothetical protein n=1 Tax=Cyanophyceae TaxID=3028117 RepID=UPI0002DD0A7C|nr:hypothetical protein [Picosynechococcus sp. PCC 7002]
MGVLTDESSVLLEMNFSGFFATNGTPAIQTTDFTIAIGATHGLTITAFNSACARAVTAWTGLAACPERHDDYS